MVLLRNEGDLCCPVAVRTADGGRARAGWRAVANLGDGGSSDVYPPEVSTLLDGVRDAFPAAEVVHHDTDARVAEGADLCVVVVGCTKDDEGEFIDVGTSESMASMFPPPPGRRGSGRRSRRPARRRVPGPRTTPADEDRRRCRTRGGDVRPGR